MSDWAYKDKTRLERISAYAAAKLNHNLDYYCPNPKCNAVMHIVCHHGLNRPYFRAKPSMPHIDGCAFAKSSGQIDDYIEKSFNYSSAIQNLLKPSASRKLNSEPAKDTNKYDETELNEKPLKTLREMYSCFKKLDPQDCYNGMKIASMLADTRSYSYYRKGISGEKIVELKYLNYYPDKKTINFKYPADFDKAANRKILFVKAVFEDETLFKTINKTLYNNREGIIVMAGIFKYNSETNSFNTCAISKKQFYIV